MESVLYSWLGTAAITPFVTLLSTWTFVVFFTYRKRWRLADIFLCSLTAHEIIFSLFGFGFAVLNIIRPVLDTPCSFLIWGLTATRIFHLSTLTSLLLDRALSSKFPYTYRYSVKKSQVQYHLGVLGIIAIFVGVTAVFARAPPSVEGICSIHPLAWNFKFSVFLSSVYGMLLVTGFVCCFTVAVGKCNKKGNNEKYSSPTNWESGRSSSSSNSSKALKEDWNAQRDDEWTTVASVCWLSYIVNHGPFLAMTIMGIIVPTFWSPWLDNVTVWMSLAQGILIPMLLLAADLPHRRAVKNMLRQPGRIYRHLSDNSGFLMQVADVQYPKPSVPTSMMMCPPNCTPTHSVFPVPQRLRWTPNSLPSLQSLSLDIRHPPKLFCPSEDSISKSSSRCLSPLPPMGGRDIYSSLDSSCYTLLSLRSCSSNNSTTSKRPSEEDAASITTNALDDFEFHGGQDNENVQPRNKIFSITKLKNLENQSNRRHSNPEHTKQNDSIDNQEHRGRGNSRSNSCNRTFLKGYEPHIGLASDKSSNLHNTEQYIPNFSNNNLVFLSTKPLQELNVPINLADGNKEEITAVTKTPALVRCIELSPSKNSPNKPVRIDSNDQQQYGISSASVTVSNGSAFRCTDSTKPDQRLIIYSEYL